MSEDLIQATFKNHEDRIKRLEEKFDKTPKANKNDRI